MTVVLDTNVILQARAVGHRYWPIFGALLAGRYAIAVSTEIAFEYEEVFTVHVGTQRWQSFSEALDVSFQRHGNVHHIEPSFHFHLIPADPDDNKFADCAIAANADYLVTDDAHFDAMKTAG